MSIVYARLPEKDSKGQDAFVKVTNRKLEGYKDTEDGKEFKIPQQNFEFPQIQELDDLVSLAGDNKKIAVEFVNDALANAATTKGKNYIRNATTGTEEEIIAAGLKVSHDFTLEETEKVSAAEAKEKISQLAELVKGGNLSEADLAARVRAMFGA